MRAATLRTYMTNEMCNQCQFIMNNSPTETDTKMEEVLRDFVLNTNVLKSAFQISGEE